MVSKNDLRIGVKFETDNQALDLSKQKLVELTSSLQKIQESYKTTNLTGNAREELKLASNEAKKLEQILNSSWNSKLGQLDLNKFNTSLKQSYKNIGDIKTALNGAGTQGVIAFNNIASSILNTNIELKKSSTLLDKMALTMANTVRFGISSSIFNSMTGAISKAYNYAKDLDSSLNSIRIVSGQSADEMERYAKYANKAAKDLGASTLDYTDASLIYYQQGLKGQDVTDRTDITVKMANVLGTSAEEVSEYLTAIWNNFDDGTKTLEYYADVLTALGASTASSSEEIAEGLSKFAAIGDTVGLSYEYATTALATVVAETRQSADTVGTAFKTLFARIQDLELGKTLDDGTTLGKYAQALEKVGINIKDQNGELKNMDDILDEMGQKWTTLNKDQQVALAQNVAGVRQYNQLVALMDNWDKFGENLKTASDATGTLQEQQDIYLDSVQAHLQKVRTEAQKTYDILFDTDAVNSMADAVTGLLGIFNSFLTGLGGGTSALTFFGATFTNIFSKQIGAALERTIENFKTMKANLSGADLKTQFANEITKNYALQGENVDPSSARVQTEARIAQQIATFKEQISQEEYNQLMILQKEMGLNAEKIDFAKNYQKYLKEAGLSEKINVDTIKTQLNLKKQELQSQKDLLKYLELANMPNYKKSKNQKKIEEELGNEFFNEEKNNQLLMGMGDKQQKEILKQVTNNTNLSHKELNELIKQQNQLINEQESKVSNINNALKGKLMLEDGSVQKMKEYNEQGEKGLQQLAQEKQRQQALQAGVQLLSTSIQLATALSGIFRTLNDDSLSAGEKISAIGTTLLMALPMIISSISSINKVLPSLLLQLKLVQTQEELTAMSGLKMWATILGPIALVVAGIASVVLIVKQLSDAYNADAIAAEQAAAAAKNAKQVFEDTSKAAEDLKNTVSDYSEALQQIKNLTSGTEDYTKALETANAKAKELIETFGLYDQVYTKNGLILFNDDVLENLESQMDAATKLAEAQKYTTQISANQAQLRSNQTDLGRAIGTTFDPRELFGDILLAPFFGITTMVDDFKGVTDEQVSEIKNNLIQLKEEHEEEYLKYTKSSSAFEEWIRKTYQGNYEMELLAHNIGEQVDGFKDLIESTKELTKVNNYYIDQLNKAELENTYGSQLKQMATNQLTGKFDEAKYQQMLDVLNNAPIQEQIKQMKSDRRNLISSENLDKAKMWSGEFNTKGNLNNLLDEELRQIGISTKQVGTINDDESLAKQYAKTVKKMTDAQVNTLQFVNGKLKDLEGNIIADASSNEERGALRAGIFGTAVAEFGDEQINEKTQKYTQAILDFENQLQANAMKAGQQYGTDFSMALLNALSDPQHKIDLSSVTGLNPDEIKQLGDITQEQFAEMFNLSDESLSLVSNTNVEKLYNSFKEAAAAKDWNIDEEIAASMSKKSAEIDAFGSDLSKKKFAELEEDVRIYAKNLMEVAKSSDDVAESMKYDSDSAVDFALKVIKMNKAIDTLADNFEDWNSILKESKDYSEEYAQAMYNTKEAIADVYDVSSDYVSNDFIIQHLSEIEKIATGDEEAIEGLRDALSEDIFVNILVNNQIDEEVISSYKGLFRSLREEIEEQLSLDGVKVGQDLNTDEFLDKLNELIRRTGMDINEVNALMASLKLEPTFETQEMHVPRKEKITQTIHEVQNANTRTFEDGTKVTEYTATDRVVDLGEKVTDETVTIYGISGDGTSPQIKTVKAAPSGSFNNYSSVNKGGKSPGKSSKSGGGSTKKPNTIDPLKEQADRYHQVNTQIAKVDNQLKRLTSQQEKFVGVKLIENLNKQWALLNIQVENYAKKLRIAQQEQQELRDKLAAKGTLFNADGTISNYMAMFNAQQEYVNSLIANYNSMSAEAQESYKDTVEKAKEDFKEFQKDLDRYDTLVSSEIPGLQQSIQDALDQQIELNIKKFNMEVTITLNMAEAERDWNAWKKKVLDGIKESDILGNAKARLQDFSSYYNEAATASIQVQTRHLEDTLTQLRKMDAGEANVYGDNRSQGLEDLQTYYKQLMEDLEGVLNLQEEIHKAYLDMMDEAQEKFKEQLDTYSMIGELLQNNMKVIQLIYGENAYSQLNNYYQQQYDNNSAQLDFLKQQKQLWAEQMELYKEGSDEWKSAKEKWMEATKELSSALTEALQTEREAFENTIKEIFQELNNLVTDSAGLDYVNEEWELINKNADEYLDTINAVAGIRDLEFKYLKSINDTSNVKYQQRLNNLMQDELTTLRAMDKISQADLDRANLKYQIALAQIALEEAQQNKSQMRLRRDTQGNYTYQYVADKEEIEKAKQELTNLYTDLYNFDKDKYTENLENIYKIWEEYQEKMAAAALINDPEERAAKELLIEEQYSELMNSLLDKNTAYRLNLQESAFLSLSNLYEDDLAKFTSMTQAERDSLLNEVGGAFKELLEIYGIDAEALKKMTIEEQNAIIDNLGDAFNKLTGFYNLDRQNFEKLAQDNKDVLVNKIVPQWTSSIQKMADKISGNGGLQKTTQAAMEKIKTATAEYEKKMQSLTETAGKTTTEIGKGLDKDITKTQQLVKDNKELTQSYRDQLKAVAEVVKQIDTLIAKYQRATAAAKEATTAAYNYWHQDQEQQAQAAREQEQTVSSADTNQQVENITSGDSSVGSGLGSQGDGIVNVGDSVVLNGLLATSSYNAPSLNPLSRYRGASLYVQMVNEGKRSPYHLGTSPTYSSKTAVGWVDLDQISGYDTGGYTGDWTANNGRLAFLHEKELVLNAEDTKNILNVVSIVRNLTEALNSNILARLSQATAGNQMNTGAIGEFEQNVHVEAIFPNVRESKEIEEALNNLTNSASQRIYSKHR